MKKILACTFALILVVSCVAKNPQLSTQISNGITDIGKKIDKATDFNTQVVPHADSTGKILLVQQKEQLIEAKADTINVGLMFAEEERYAKKMEDLYNKTYNSTWSRLGRALRNMFWTLVIGGTVAGLVLGYINFMSSGAVGAIAFGSIGGIAKFIFQLPMQIIHYIIAWIISLMKKPTTQTETK